MKKKRKPEKPKDSKYPAVLRPLLTEILDKIRDSSGCQSVAIRLNEEGDFPYYVQLGFPEFFISRESSLNVKDDKGEVILGEGGVPFVECMCGNVLKGRFNSKSSFFTKSGAFWTNSTTRLLSSLSEREKQEVGRTRNTCHNFGYESVALVPVHARSKTIGLVQINDPRENRFSLQTIEKCQLLADSIGSIILNLVEVFEEAGEIRAGSSEKSSASC